MKRFFEEHTSVVIICIVVSLLLCIIGCINNIDNDESVTGKGLLKIVGDNLTDTIDTYQKQIIPNENLFKNSLSFQDDWILNEISKDYSKGLTRYKNHDCLAIHSNNYNEIFFLRQNITDKILPNTRYTVSGYVALSNIKKGTEDFKAMFYVDWYKNNNFLGMQHKDFPISDSSQWEHIKFSFKTPSQINESDFVQAGVYLKDFLGTVYLRNIKLEEGPKATPYVE